MKDNTRVGHTGHAHHIREKIQEGTFLLNEVRSLAKLNFLASGN